MGYWFRLVKKYFAIFFCRFPAQSWHIPASQTSDGSSQTWHVEQASAYLVDQNPPSNGGNIHGTFQNGGYPGVVQNGGSHGTLQNGGNNRYGPFQGVVNHGTSGYNSGFRPPAAAAVYPIRGVAEFPDLQGSPFEIPKQKPSDKFKDYK
jgi:hypothetical protein